MNTWTQEYDTIPPLAVNRVHINININLKLKSEIIPAVWGKGGGGGMVSRYLPTSDLPINDH